MKTPICDFVREYAENNALRMHMPGHKGVALLGPEKLDITEIEGADSLYEASGIIAESEKNAGELFGCRTFYVTEGSSQCIRAMLHLAALDAKQNGKKPLIAAARNVHKAFLSAVALLDLEVAWICGQQETYLSCPLDGSALENALQDMAQLPTAVYLTSPDYLGAMADICSVAQVCRRYGILLLIDNAHGAYLHFLPESLHPMDLGADICCDSAHKTLPVLTGGAYLQLRGDRFSEEQVRNALALFGSTSPSYLILQSLDASNRYLESYSPRLRTFLPAVDKLKANLRKAGYCLYGQEPLKITICAKAYGYLGTELAGLLAEKQIICEFADRDYLVLMLTPENGAGQLDLLETVLVQIPQKTCILQDPPAFYSPRRVLSVREAMLSPSEILPAAECMGRIVAAPGVSCPPAVPVLICGEQIDAQGLACLAYYGIDRCCVVKEA